MFLIGLTGSIGTGKSTVSRSLRARNVPVIDCDQLARDVVRPNTSCWRAIRKHFGPQVIDPETQELNREVLGQLIFDEPARRLELNRITHPAIQRLMIMQILFYFITFQPFVVLDIPLLFEVNRMRRFLSYVLVVWCRGDQQRQRVRQRDGFEESEVESRIRAQISIDEKRQLADFVFDNSGPPEALAEQLDQFLGNLRYPTIFYLARIGLGLIYVSIGFASIKLINLVLNFM